MVFLKHYHKTALYLISNYLQWSLKTFLFYFKDWSTAKLKKNIFIGSQIKEFIKYNDFVHCLNIPEQETRHTFMDLRILLGNHKALTYKDGIQKL